MRNRYLEFLCDIVGRKNEYALLLGELHRIEFYSLIPNDDNRGADGVYLRQQFLDEVGPTGAPSLPQGPCTVLEMLIGLSFRLEFETAQSRWEKTTGDWFWILMDNLGLILYNDSAFLDPETCDKIVTSVTVLLERGYESDGNGGIFPLKNPKKDQRKIEIWYQMSSYLLENYPI